MKGTGKEQRMPKNPSASHCNFLMFGFGPKPVPREREHAPPAPALTITNESHETRMRPPPSLPAPPPPTITFISTLDDHGRVFERFTEYFRSAVGTSDANAKFVHKTWIRINDYAETRLLPATAISQWADHSKLFDDVQSVNLVNPTPMSIAACICFEVGMYVGRVSDFTRNTVVVLTSYEEVKDELLRVRDRYQLGGCLQVIHAEMLLDKEEETSGMCDDQTEM